MCDKFVGNEIIICFKETRWEYRDCIFLNSVVDCWRTFTKSVMNIHNPQNSENIFFWIDEKLAPQEEHFSSKLACQKSRAS